MSTVCTPVSVVTATSIGPDGAPLYSGTTVSAFSSLSLAPVQFIAALDTKSRLLHTLEIGSAIGLNVLASDQEGLARHFATKEEDKFSSVECVAMDPAPRLAGTSAWFSGRIVKMAAAGDHVVVVATVEDVDHSGGLPLLYWNRGFTSPKIF